MKALDLNSENKRTILLIHPMLSSAEGMKILLADNLGNDLRYIIPDLSAHGRSANKTYHTSKEEAEEIYNYLKAHEIMELELAYGASLGGVVLLQLLRHKDIKIKKVCESSNVFPNISILLNFDTDSLEYILSNILKETID